MSRARGASFPDFVLCAGPGAAVDGSGGVAYFLGVAAFWGGVVVGGRAGHYRTKNANGELGEEHRSLLIICVRQQGPTQNNMLKSSERNIPKLSGSSPPRLGFQRVVQVQPRILRKI